MIGSRWAWILLAAGATNAPATGTTSLRVTFDRRVVTADAPVVRSEDGLLVPLRPVSRALGGQLSWDVERKTAVVRYRARRLEADEQRHEIRLDGQAMGGANLRKAQGQLLVPLTVVERLFGVRGHWHPQQRLLSFAAASGEPGPPGSGSARQPPATSGLALRLSSDRKTYAVGAPVRFTFSVINNGQAPVTLQFSSGQKYDIEVRRGGQPVWHWAADRMFTQALTSLTLAPGERKSFSESWKQQDDNGRPVPVGEYEVIATLTTTSRPQAQTTPITLRIGG